jgi:hypothetical protein
MFAPIDIGSISIFNIYICQDILYKMRHVIYNNLN